MPRPPVEPSALRSINQGAKRDASLERRYVPTAASIYKVTQKLLVDTATVVFDDLDQNFTVLYLLWSTATEDSTAEAVLCSRLNDGSEDYSWHINSPGGIGDSTDMTSQTATTAYAGLGFIPSYSGPAELSTGSVQFPDYTNISCDAISYSGHGSANVPEGIDPDPWVSGGYLAQTGPLTKITLYAFEANGPPPNSPVDFRAGSRFTLLGF